MTPERSLAIAQRQYDAQLPHDNDNDEMTPEERQYAHELEIERQYEAKLDARLFGNE